jgi:hypothetical protein
MLKDVPECSEMSWDDIKNPRANRDTILLHLDDAPEHLSIFGATEGMRSL